MPTGRRDYVDDGHRVREQVVGHHFKRNKCLGKYVRGRPRATTLCTARRRASATPRRSIPARRADLADTRVTSHVVGDAQWAGAQAGPRRRGPACLLPPRVAPGQAFTTVYRSLLSSHNARTHTHTRLARTSGSRAHTSLRVAGVSTAKPAPLRPPSPLLRSPSLRSRKTCEPQPYKSTARFHHYPLSPTRTRIEDAGLRR